MVTWEFEAAEALTELAQFSNSQIGPAISGELKRQILMERFQEKSHETMAADQFNGSTSTRITTSHEKTEKIIEHIPDQSRGRIRLPKSVKKPRSKLTASEKQERRTRRIMANREAARETIRRRQAMFMELNKKAVDMSDENENLKKKKELAVEEYHSLRCRNELLKAKLATSKKPRTGSHHMQVNPRANQAENLYSWPNHPSMVPYVWPPIIPPANAFNFQTATPHSHMMGPSHFPMLVYPMPCMLPFFGHGHTPHPQFTYPPSFVGSGHLSFSSNKSMATGLTSQSKNHIVETTACYPDGTIYVPGLFSHVKPQERPAAGPGINDVGSLQLYDEMEYIYAAAAEARKKRKELMIMKK